MHGHCGRTRVMGRDQPHLELGPSAGSAHGAEGAEPETRPGCRPFPVRTPSSWHRPKEHCCRCTAVGTWPCFAVTCCASLLCPPKERSSRNSIKAAVSGSGQREAVSEQVTFAIMDAPRPSQLPSPRGSAAWGCEGLTCDVWRAGLSPRSPSAFPQSPLVKR